MSDKQYFNTDPQFLSSRLFNNECRNRGTCVYLNVNVLPDFINFLKQKLTPSELIRLEDYQLQIYILELSTKETQTRSVEELSDQVITHIRSDCKFWNGNQLPNSANQEKQIQEEILLNTAAVQYREDVQKIKAQTPQFPENSFRFNRRNKIPKSLEIVTDQINTKPQTKGSVNSFAEMPGFVVKQLTKGEPESFKPKEDKQSLIAKLQNCVEYFLCKQKIEKKVSKRVELIRTRELSRNRVKAESAEQKQDNGIPNDSIVIQEQEQEEDYEESPFQIYGSFKKHCESTIVFDSKFASKRHYINLNHNILQVLFCLVGLLQGQVHQRAWFEQNWNELRLKWMNRDQQSESSQEGEKEASEERNCLPEVQGYCSEDLKKSVDQEKEKELQSEKFIDSQRVDKENEKTDLIEDESPKKDALVIPAFDQNWKSPRFSFENLSAHLSEKLLSLRHIYFLAKNYLENEESRYSQVRECHRQIEKHSMDFSHGFLVSSKELDDIQRQYSEMRSRQKNESLLNTSSSGKFSWEAEDYLNFLKAFLSELKNPSNNKKITTLISRPDRKINCEDVKKAKNDYKKVMQARMRKGEIGGGKRGLAVSKEDFIKNDIQNFSIKYFDKKVCLKVKRRKRSEEDDGVFEDY